MGYPSVALSRAEHIGKPAGIKAEAVVAAGLFCQMIAAYVTAFEPHARPYRMRRVVDLIGPHSVQTTNRKASSRMKPLIGRVKNTVQSW